MKSRERRCRTPDLAQCRPTLPLNSSSACAHGCPMHTPAKIGPLLVHLDTRRSYVRYPLAPLLALSVVLSVAALAWLAWLTFKPEHVLRPTYDEIHDVQAQVADLDVRVSEVEQAAGGEDLATAVDDLQSNVADLDSRLTDLEDASGTSDVQSTIDDLESRVSELESDVGAASGIDLAARVDELESDVSEVCDQINA